MSQPVNKISKNIYNLRKSRNLNQDEVAKFLGCSRATVTNYENGRRTPDYNVLIKIANFYNVSTDYILGVEKELSTNDPEKKIACRYTGLSQNSIDILHELNTLEFPECRDVIQTIDTLLVYERWEKNRNGSYFHNLSCSVLTLISNYLKIYIKRNEYVAVDKVGNVYSNHNDNGEEIVFGYDYTTINRAAIINGVMTQIQIALNKIKHKAGEQNGNNTEKE